MVGGQVKTDHGVVKAGEFVVELPDGVGFARFVLGAAGTGVAQIFGDFLLPEGDEEGFGDGQRGGDVLGLDGGASARLDEEGDLVLGVAPGVFGEFDNGADEGAPLGAGLG